MDNIWEDNAECYDKGFEDGIAEAKSMMFTILKMQLEIYKNYLHTEIPREKETWEGGIHCCHILLEAVDREL